MAVYFILIDEKTRLKEVENAPEDVSHNEDSNLSSISLNPKRF